MHLLPNTPLVIKFAFLLMWVVLTSGIIAVFVMPIIFNFFIIPKIEKRLGQKLVYGSIWDNIPNVLGNFDPRHLDLVIHIIPRYLMWKLKENPYAIKLRTDYGLGKAGFRIENASRFEIIMSFLVMTNLLIFIGALLIMFYIVFKYK